MRKCVVCTVKNPEPLARLPSILIDLRIRGHIVGVSVPLRGEYVHVSCVLRLRAKIVKKEKASAIAPTRRM